MNGIAGILKIFYPVIPSVSSEHMDRVEKAVGKLTQKSSVEEFDCLQSAVDDANKHTGEGCDDKKTVRGKAFRDFSRFLAQQENDPDETFCDLRRVLTPSGDVCWTTDEQVKRIQAEAETETEADTDTDETLTQSTVPSKQATPPPIPSEQATPPPVPSEQVIQPPVPSEQVTQPPVPSEQATQTPVPSEQATQTPIPSEQVTQTPVPSEQVTQPPVPSEQVTQPPVPSDQATQTPNGCCIAC